MPVCVGSLWARLSRAVHAWPNDSEFVFDFSKKIVPAVAGALTIRDNKEAATVKVLRWLQHSNARTTQQSDVP